MATTVSKGRIWRCTVEVDDQRLAQMKAAPQLANTALQEGANYWHTGVLPGHFTKAAHGRYGYANRAFKYLKNRQKGSKPDLVFSGSLRRDLVSRAAFKSAASFVELKMTARVLNFAPNMAESNQDAYVKHKNGRGYPNLKKEIKAILPDEREAVAAVVAKSLERAFDTGLNSAAMRYGVGVTD